jgi:ketosteroid isomerase-like protein
MSPDIAAREKLFEGFARALFRRDMDALYQVVSPDFVWRYHDGLGAERVLDSRDAILAHLDERKDFFTESRFHEVVYHHTGDISFMTFRVSEIVRATGERREQRGIERYTFSGGRIATKDVYRKPVEV